MLVDAMGDQPSIFGVPSSEKGFSDWWMAGDSVDAGALTYLASPLSRTLKLVSAGAEQSIAPQGANEARFKFSEVTVVDAGIDRPANPYIASLTENSGLSLLVIRPCYLAVRRAVEANHRIDGIVVIDEPGRSLTAADVSDVVGARVAAQIPWDAGIARAIDAGRIANRVPRAARMLEKLADQIVGEWVRES